MPNVRPNKSQAPSNSDAYNLAADLATLADSLNVPIQVASQAERDALTKKLGMTVIRTDTGSHEWTDGNAWYGIAPVVPLGHMGRTGGFQSLTTSAQTVIMNAAQLLRAGMTFSSAANGLIIPVAGLYEVRVKAYFSGSTSTTYIAQALKNNVNTGAEVRTPVNAAIDSTGGAAVLVQCNVNDQITIGAYTVGSGTCNVWGTDGYNGIYVEAEYKCA